MPSLGKYDPLESVIASKEEVNLARRVAETVIEVNGIRIQFDNISRQRMKDVLAIDNEEPVTWYSFDNEPFVLSKEDFSDLIIKAGELIGLRTLAVFERAAALKSRIGSDNPVSMAELRLDCWVC